MVSPVSEYELLLENAHMGAEARRFLKSRLGKYLLDSISAKEKSALDKLRTVDPHDFKAVQALQNEIEVAVISKRHFIDVIIMGDQATMRLQSMEDDDELGDYTYEEEAPGLDEFTDEQHNGELE